MCGRRAIQRRARCAAARRRLSLFAAALWLMGAAADTAWCHIATRPRILDAIVAPPPSEEWSSHPSANWSPPPSAAWWPSTAWLPSEDPAGACFAAPPPLVDAPAWGGGEPVRYFAAPPSPCDPWRVQSHFMPGLGRHGIVAPRAPGVESVHSPFVAAGPRVPHGHLPSDTLFAPPPVVPDGNCDTGGAPHAPRPAVQPRG